MYTTNVTSTEAEIMSMHLGLEQALTTVGVKKITIITDTIHGAQKLFDISLHPYQTLVTSTIENIHNFFSQSPDNTIAIWHCPIKYKWKPHKDVDKEVKLSKVGPILPNKELWDFSRKSEYKDLLNYWKMSFQALDKKGHNFLNLDNVNEGTPIEPYYKKGEAWLKYFSHSNFTYARMTRLITNYAPIGAYRLRFFPLEESLC